MRIRRSFVWETDDGHLMKEYYVFDTGTLRLHNSWKEIPAHMDYKNEFVLTMVERFLDGKEVVK